MVDLAIEDFPRLRTSSIEFTLPQPSYTINTIDTLEKNIQTKIFAHYGATTFNFDRWKNLKKFLKAIIYVYPRPNCEISENYMNHPHVKIVNAPRMKFRQVLYANADRRQKAYKIISCCGMEILDEMNFTKKPL
jgi:nicotinate-nucleotide adenylyltransferase